CVEICPVDCIYEGTKEGFPDMLFIHPDECIDCGVCQPECPVTAIFPEDDVPEEWHDYIRINKEFFGTASLDLAIRLIAPVRSRTRRDAAATIFHGAVQRRSAKGVP